MTFPIKGACQCGQVTYELNDKPLNVFACHCKECQKLSTSPFSITAVIDSSKIEFSGELKSWQRIADSGNRNQAMFCPDCGNRIYHVNPDDQQTVKLKLKPINSNYSELFEPKAHVWVSEKLDWYQIPNNVKVFSNQPS